MVAEGGSPEEIVDRLGVRQVSDRGALEPLVAAVLEENPDKAAAYRGGKVGLMGFFMGQVMRRSGGSANPELAKVILEERLGSD